MSDPVKLFTVIALISRSVAGAVLLAVALLTLAYGVIVT
jgi:hypothetical protein